VVTEKTDICVDKAETRWTLGLTGSERITRHSKKSYGIFGILRHGEGRKLPSSEKKNNAEAFMLIRADGGSGGGVRRGSLA